MKVFVTGVCGQLGHDVMNELANCGYVSIGSDIKDTYSGIEYGSAVTTIPYFQLDITNQEMVADVHTLEDIRKTEIWIKENWNEDDFISE